MSEPGVPPATLPAALRLKTQRQFRAAYQRGRRAAGEWLTAVVLPRSAAAAPAARLGVSVGKDHGGAVRRNKLKRLLREAFRRERHRLPPAIDLVLIPRQRSERFPLAALRAELVRLVARALAAPPRRRSPPRPP